MIKLEPRVNDFISYKIYFLLPLLNKVRPYQTFTQIHFLIEVLNGAVTCKVTNVYQVGMTYYGTIAQKHKIHKFMFKKCL